MLEKLNSIAKFLLTACVWFVIYLAIEQTLLKWNWGFDITSYRHWQILNNHWKAGWKIDTLYEWAFILIIFTFIPLYLATLSYIMHPKVFPKIQAKLSLIYKNKITLAIYHFFVPVKKEEKQEEVKKDEASTPAFEPDPTMPTEIASLRQGAGQAYFAQDAIEEKKDETPLDMPVAPLMPEEETKEEKEEDSISDVLSRIQDIIEEPQVKEKSVAKAPKAQKENFEYQREEIKFEQAGFDVLRNKAGFDIVALSQQKIIFINFLNQNISWVADEEFLDDAEPVWISQEASVTSPVYETLEKFIQATKKIKKVLGQTQTSYIPIVSLLKGEIQNEKEMLNVWKKKKVYVLNEDPSSSLKKLDDFTNQMVDSLSAQEIQKIERVLK